MNQITEYEPTQVYNNDDPEYVAGMSPGVGKTLLMKIQNGVKSITQSINTLIGEYSTTVSVVNAHKNRHITGGADAITPSDIGAASAPVEKAATLYAASWVGSSAPYTQTVSVTGVTSSTKGVVGLSDAVTDTQAIAAADAHLWISGKSTNTITIKANGKIPTIDIPIALQILG